MSSSELARKKNVGNFLSEEFFSHTLRSLRRLLYASENILAVDHRYYSTRRNSLVGRNRKNIVNTFPRRNVLKCRI